MSYEDLDKARAERATREAEKEAWKTKKDLYATPTTEEATAGKGKKWLRAHELCRSRRAGAKGQDGANKPNTS